MNAGSGTDRTAGGDPTIQPLDAAGWQLAARVLAAGMLDNPLHVRVFGTDERRREQRLRRFMACAADHVGREGTLLGAYRGHELVGVLGVAPPGCCRPVPPRSWRYAAAIAAGNPPAATWRVARWLAAWARHDPPGPHWHLGPLAVLPAWRRRGVGGALLRRACADLDGAMTWLETDLERNVGFYRAFGFVLAHEEEVLGVRTWFMRRLPGAGPGR